MRINLGMKVEARIPEAATNIGAWRTGEVIWGNGGPDSASILRKFVRLIPDPHVEMPEDLAAGDIVELFDSNLWKWVEVVRVGDRQSLIHKNGQIPIESAVPVRPIAGKNIESKAIGSGEGNGGSNFAAHAVKLGKTKRSEYTVDADILRDFKKFQGNGNTNRIFTKRLEPSARYNGNIELMDVHSSHYLEKRQETE